jgi:hypothetical protein
MKTLVDRCDRFTRLVQSLIASSYRRDVILGDELVGRADVVIYAKPSRFFNPGLKLQPCRAGPPNIEHDLESPACLLGAASGACQGGNVGIVMSANHRRSKCRRNKQ